MSEIKICILSNIVLQPILHKPFCDMCKKKHVKVRLQYLNIDDFLVKGLPDETKQTDLLILWLNFEQLFPILFDKLMIGKINIDIEVNDSILYIDMLYNRLKIYNINILPISFEQLFMQNLIPKNAYEGNIIINQLNLALKDNYKKIIDINFFIASIGIEKSYNMRNKYHWNSPYSELLCTNMANEIGKYILVKQQSKIKCIILDCDNVLWSGILNEDGIDKIQLSSTGMGKFYKDFQRQILIYYYSGIILAICSKNSYDDIKNVFECHNDMLLRKNHIAYFAVNWENKVDNIRKICSSLCINLENVLFIDDSYHEIKNVNYTLPDVKTIQFHRSTIYKELVNVNFYANYDENNVLLRQLTYKTNYKRDKLRIKFNSNDDFIKALNIKVKINIAKSSELSRINELSQRTNRCTNGKRYTIEKLYELMNSKQYVLKTVYVSDCYSDLGLVGVFGVLFHEYQYFLDLFSLSCRAIGRKIEEDMISDIIKSHKKIDVITFSRTKYNDDILTMLKNSFKSARLLIE